MLQLMDFQKYSGVFCQYIEWHFIYTAFRHSCWSIVTEVARKRKKNRRDFNTSLINNYSRLLKNMFELEIFQSVSVTFFTLKTIFQTQTSHSNRLFVYPMNIPW